jgi:hypothetical protein
VAVSNAVPAAGARVAGLRRQAVSREGGRVVGLGEDLTRVRCRGEWVTVGVGVDAIPGLALTVDLLPNGAAATLLHRHKDVNFGEDARLIHVGQGPTILALLCDAALSLLHRAGVRRVAARLRIHGHHPEPVPSRLAQKPCAKRARPPIAITSTLVPTLLPTRDGQHEPFLHHGRGADQAIEIPSPSALGEGFGVRERRRQHPSSLCPPDTPCEPARWERKASAGTKSRGNANLLPPSHGVMSSLEKRDVPSRLATSGFREARRGGPRTR